MVIFFGFTAFFEALSCIMYLILWVKQRGKHDISGINRVDCQGTCFFILLRIVWAIGLSIFFLISFNGMQKGLPGDPYGEITRGQKETERELNVVSTIVYLIIIFESLQIIGFVFGLAYQPQDYVREVQFDSLENKGGIVPEVSANERIY